MGIYGDILVAINNRQLLLLAVLGAGCAVGLLVTTHGVNFALKRFHDQTMGFLTGLVIGSLYAIWPFKTFELAGARRVDMHAYVPPYFDGNVLLTVMAAVAGAVIVAIFVYADIRRTRIASAT